ncbi:MAG: hypothetical protein GWO02_22655, partial [Gammaproteobacteria bacterium]|nr:hypothetical protein [Gammaproteobacteria bacterium]
MRGARTTTGRWAVDPFEQFTHLDPNPGLRAELGARWLDRERPGWWDHVDLGLLASGEPGTSVPAQVFGSEAAARARLVGHPWAPDVLSWLGLRPLDAVDERRLRAAWEAQIEHRIIDRVIRMTGYTPREAWRLSARMMRVI